MLPSRDALFKETQGGLVQYVRPLPPCLMLPNMKLFLSPTRGSPVAQWLKAPPAEEKFLRWSSTATTLWGLPRHQMTSTAVNVVLNINCHTHTSIPLDLQVETPVISSLLFRLDHVDQGCPTFFDMRSTFTFARLMAAASILNIASWADPGGSRGSGPPPPFGPRCRLFNIGPKL